jgi:TolA-binding protein
MSSFLTTYQRKFLSDGQVILVLAVSILFSCLWQTTAQAAIPNHLQRLEVKPKQNYTRITVKVDEDPNFEVSQLPGSRLRIKLTDTEGPIYRRFKSYSDKNIGGIVTKRKGRDLYLTFAIAPRGVGWRVVHFDGIKAFSVDVGPMFEPKPLQPTLPGRERIWSGAEKLLRDFDPPIKPEVPFHPTDRQVLKSILSDEDQKLFLAAESALYKGRLTAAEDVFSQFAQRKSPIRPLALYRLGETQYRLQKYPQALAAFREAEQLWPDFLVFNPTAMFYYGDSIARSGDLPGGRQLLARLIKAHADKKYAPVLLVRMADVLARQGNDLVAQAIYRTIADNFTDNKAHQIARMKLADRVLLKATPVDYRPLGELYREIAERAGDYDLREEASFKSLLLESINGPAQAALSQLIDFQKRFPRGVYVTITRDIREDLVALSFKEIERDKKPAEIVNLAKVNQEFLAMAVRIPEFLPALSAAFDKADQSLDLIALYVGMLDKPWVGDNNVPYLYMQVAEHAELLGDNVLAKKMLGTLMSKYPAHPQVRQTLERLGALHYADGELKDVKARLYWILNKNERATDPDSYYYLGKSLWNEKQYLQTAQAMELYVASVKSTTKSPKPIGDAYYLAAMARNASGDRKTALLHLEQGLKVVSPERADQFLFKLGELSALDGKTQQARSYYEKVAQGGKDPDWRRMALQALENIPPEQKSKKQ